MNGVERLREYAESVRWGGECRILHAHHGDFARECSERECDDCRAAYLQAIADEIERDRADSPKVLAADGEPLEVGQTVYTLNDDRPYTVKKVESNRVSVNAGEGAYDVWKAPTYLTHQRPVLDADGVPIKVGDTVWDIETGIEFEVSEIVGCAVTMSNGGYYSSAFTRYCPSKLTHTKPEPPDSRRAIVNEIGDEMAARIDLLVSSGRWSDAD